MNYVVQDTSLTAVADAIRKQTKSTEQIPFPNGFVSEIGKIDADSSYNNGYQQGYTEGEAKGEAQGYDRGYGEGQKAEYDKFWDSYQLNGNRIIYDYAFYNSSDIGGWNEEEFKPKYTIAPTSANNMCRWIGVADMSVYDIDTSNCQNMPYIFGSDKIEHLGIIDVSSATNWAGICSGCKKLHTVDKLIISENTPEASNPFYLCDKLVNLTIEGVIAKSILFNYCVSLSKESVQSIIDHLKDLTSETAQTLTLQPKVKANLTEEQKAQITSKNWTLA